MLLRMELLCLYLKWRQPYKSTSGVEAIIPTLRETEMGEWRGQPGYRVKPSWGEGKKKGRRRRRGEERMGEGERKRKREKVFSSSQNRAHIPDRPGLWSSAPLSEKDCVSQEVSKIHRVYCCHLWEGIVVVVSACLRVAVFQGWIEIHSVCGLHLFYYNSFYSDPLFASQETGEYEESVQHSQHHCVSATN